MQDSFFIVFTVCVIAALIYILYRIMLSTSQNRDNELQITSEELIQQLVILHKQRKYHIVENLAKKYLEKKRKDDSVRNILARSYYDASQIYDAIEQAQIIINHQPLNLEIKIFLANCYQEVKKNEKAITILQGILNDAPDNIIAIKTLAELFLKINQKLSALKMYKRLDAFLENNQEKIKNKITIADIQIEFKEYDQALEQYKQILEICPDELSVQKRLIELYKVMQRYDDLIESASSLLEKYPREEEVSLWAMRNLMDIYKMKQDYDNALKFAYEMKEHPLSEKIQAEDNIAKILLEKGQIEDSIEILKGLIKESPENIDLKKNLSKAFEKLNDFDSAISIYRKILEEIDPKYIEQINMEISDLYSNWAIFLFSQEDNDECFKKFLTALQYYDKNPKTYYKIANVNKAIRNFNEAIAQYHHAIDLDPEFVDCYYEMAECYEAIGSIYEQKNILEESLEISPDNAKIHYQLGLIYQAQNNRPSALNYMKKAVELDETFTDAKCKLALMFENLGDKENAILLYEEVLKIEPENETASNNLKMLRT